MQLGQLKHTAVAGGARRDNNPVGGEGDRGHRGRRRQAAHVRLTRADWVMIVTIVAVGLLVGYLTYTGWLPPSLVDLLEGV